MKRLRSLFDPEIHVPLLVMLPGASHAGTSVAVQVSLRDVAATVAEVTGLGPREFPGRSLSRHWLAPGMPDPTPSLSEVEAPVKTAPNQGRSPVFRGPMQAIAFGDYVYIHNGDQVEELFNVRSDPGQLHNLVANPDARSSLNELRAAFLQLRPDLETPRIAGRR